MSNSNVVSSVATGLVWLGLIGIVVLGLTHALVGLKLVLALLITFVSAIVHSYSIRYMAGDRLYNRYFVFLSLITMSALLMVTTDHIWVFGSSWILSNLLLVILMLHKAEWQSSVQASILAGINLGLGSLALMAGLFILTQHAGSTSISMIIQNSSSLNSSQMFIALGLIAIAAFIQSAQWPFHRWLLSSLNSPTPVSALMHAGLVNGGGILLAIFSPLYLKQPGWMIIIFMIGAFTALTASYWKLVQNSIKRMLACSTMAQMGFMMMQCGLGFYSAAVVHLCWHGLFKGYLFLSSGSAVQGSSNEIHKKTIDSLRFIIVCLTALLGVLVFSYVSHKPLTIKDTTFVLLGFAFVATAQVAYIFLVEKLSVLNIILATFASMAVGFFYGTSLGAVKNLLAPSLMDAPQPLNWIHVMLLSFFIAAWAIKILDVGHVIFPKSARNKMYVWALNKSQPVSSTLTMKRKDYA